MTNAKDNSLTTIAIRVDASTRMGTGHVMRCLTLATKLKEYGVNIIFLSKKHQGNLNQLVAHKGFDLFELSAPKQSIENQVDEKLWLGCSYQKDAKECLTAFNNLKIDLLIIDHYSLDYKWQKLIKTTLQQAETSQNQPLKIMVIDDLANRQHDCDILLDQTLGREHCDYKKLVPNHCQLLLGADYIMLRDEFLQNRELAITKRKSVTAVNNILITMGGTDPDNIAEKLLRWLIQFKESNNKIQVTLIANSASLFINSLREISASHHWISVINNPESMAKIMLNADIAIGSSGATAWERCCLGLPSLSIISAENQHYLNENLSKTGAIINLGRFSTLTYQNVEISLKHLINNNSTYQKMVAQSFTCCDGLGVTKVTTALLANLSHNIFLAEANYDDCQALFNWQSNSEIRKHFHNSAPVKWQQHCDWLKSTLKNKNKHLFMIKLKYSNTQASQSVGVLRLDRLENSPNTTKAKWVISIIITPEQQGKKIARKAIAEIPNIYKTQGIIAEVHHNNIASHKLFSQAGFTATSPTVYLLKHEKIKNDEQLGVSHG